MTRDQLEQAIWTACRQNHATIPSALKFVDAILAAADDYAADISDADRAALAANLAARRRAQLEASVSSRAGAAGPVVWHWQKPGSDEPRASCHGRVTRAPVTEIRARVNCDTCKQSRSWRQAG